ncbi:hypothetical protein F383_28099 [Gossypium arboreum]|uniref:Uncharacterized protein n=4 Tax=Gossypium TaxID=3633 RepID=A0A0B0PC20_GOSAR|nr:hypothetical protein ES319_A07G108400v1 [Gossypium barbadense]KAG4191521.1 hypothetical protein ERO13_A07G099100v2 [Gossypium hirsutum]KHG21909.1 hypothetical protein F383_28099 [Gossypium arboreum]
MANLQNPAVQRKRAKEAVQGFTRGSLNFLTDSRSFWCPPLLHSLLVFWASGMGLGLLGHGLGILEFGLKLYLGW